MNVLVLGANGYGGRLLTRLLANHRNVESVTAASRSLAGTAVLDDDRGISPRSDAAQKINTEYRAPEALSGERFDVVFSALPHRTSADLCEPFFGRSVVIDLSADFRLRDPDRYRRAYKSDPPQPDRQDSAIYGLVEWYRKDIRTADIIANPGCYPTATLMPLLPLAAAGQITGTVQTIAMSGISGAGRSAKRNLLLAERAENITAYNPGRLHRHAQEIEEQLGLPILFTPHLIPIKQGMAVTTTVPVRDPAAAITRLEKAYSNEPFVYLTGEVPPDTAMVRGTNRIAIGWHVEEGFLILMSTIDNLWKGASGQAVQNMNVRFGIPETTGLDTFGEV